MTPLRVDFTLRTPMIVSPTSKTLDALLSWAAVRRADFNGELQAWSVQNETGLGRHQVGDTWCPMASALLIEWQSEPEQVHYIKRQNLTDYSDAWMDGVLKKRPSIDTSRGDTKAGSYVQQTRWVKNLHAYALVQDMDLFAGLLPWVTHIGKLHHRDYGAVKSFTVTEDDFALQMWARRPLPVGSEHASPEHVLAMGALKSPYWKREEHTQVLMHCA